MLVGVFKSNQKLLSAVAILLTMALWLPAFLIDSPYEFSGLITTNYKWLDILISVSLISFQAIYLNKIVNEHKLVKDNSHVTSLMVLLFNSGGLLFLNMTQVVVANSFLVIVFHQLLKIYNVKSSHGLMFNVGFLVSVASLIYFPSVLYLFLIWIVLMYTTTPTWRDFTITLLGFSVPIIYYVSYTFVFNDLSELTLSNLLNQILGVKYDQFSLFQQLFFIDVAVISLFALMGLYVTMGRSVVRVRKMLVVVVLMLAIATATLFLNKMDYAATFLMMSIPLSIILANFFQNLKKGWLAELLFLSLLGSIVLTYFS